MKLLRCLLLATSCLAACGTVRDWREMRSAPMSLGDCYDGIEQVAAGAGFAPDQAECDRGLGTYQSRWRQRVLERNYAGRTRLRAEILVDEGSAAEGWPVRFVVEQEKAKDLRRFVDPRDEDWSADGQDAEKELFVGEALVRRLAPKSASLRERPRLDARNPWP